MNNSKLFICGSSARILNSNYFQRKIAPNLAKFKKIVLIVDHYIFHDIKENKLILSSKNKINKSYENNYVWDKKLFLILKKYNKILGISYVKRWIDFKISKEKFLKFLLSLDSNKIQIDFISCPYCNNPHKGPFNIINNKYIKLPCINKLTNIKKILLKKRIRLKKGFLQLYFASLNKGKVLISEKFFKKNFLIIKKLNLNFNFEIQYNINKGFKKILLDDYINVFTEKYVELENKKSVVYYIKNLGISCGILYFIRSKLRRLNYYKYADTIRNILKKRNIFINDGKNFSIIIKRERKL